MSSEFEKWFYEVTETADIVQMFRMEDPMWQRGAREAWKARLQRIEVTPELTGVEGGE